MIRRLLPICAVAALLPCAALAQGGAVNATPKEDEAARTMVRSIYVYDPTSVIMPSAIMAKLRTAGYSDIHDFDIEAGIYEVEAKNPAGKDVELKVDPVTGAIVDIDDNWF